MQKSSRFVQDGPRARADIAFKVRASYVSHERELQSAR